jgi:hypothetical protein
MSSIVIEKYPLTKCQFIVLLCSGKISSIVDSDSSKFKTAQRVFGGGADHCHWAMATHQSQQ